MAPPRKSARGKISSSNDLLSDAGTTPAKASKSRALAQPRKANSPRGQAGKKRSIADHRNNEEADSESVIDPTTQASSPKRARRAKDSVGSVSPPRPPEERRLRRFRDHPPKSYQERLEQLRTATVSIFDAHVVGTEEVPEFTFDVIGSPGDLYRPTIKQLPQCNCPDGLQGNQCKHICYVLRYVLRAPEHLQYQLAFLSSELREIHRASRLAHIKPGEFSDAEKEGNRKPIEGNCPVCYQDMADSTEEIVWCKGACGNNIHRGCFKEWVAATNHSPEGERIPSRCVYCRARWIPNFCELDHESLRAHHCAFMYGFYPNALGDLRMSTRLDLFVSSPSSAAQPSSSSQPREERQLE